MASHFTLTLDTQAPANPTLLLNSGSALTGDPVVAVSLGSTDLGGGANDLAQMRLWGDVDPTADPFVQPTEAASTWQAFAADYVVRFTASTGRKTLRARLKDDVCNTTVEFCDFIDLDLTSAVVTITTAIDRGRISKVAPCDSALFLWQTNQDFIAYQIRVVPSAGSPHLAGVALGTAHGSGNAAGVGVFPASTPITTVVNGADLEAASPGDTRKIVKVFVQSAAGVWSS